jgi:hypothetical protein
MKKTDLLAVSWFKSSHSNGQSACIEAGAGAPGTVPVRDSKRPDGPVLVFGARSWTVFTEGLKGV